MPKSVDLNWWRNMAEDMAAAAEAAIPTTDPAKPGSWAVLARAFGELTNWTDSRIPGWFAAAAASRTSGGGFGVNQPIVEYGQTNNPTPADAAHLITTTDYVGHHQLIGYDNGVVPWSEVVATVDALLAWQTYTQNGYTLPDSSVLEDGSINTRVHGQPHIWNPIAAAAALLRFAAIRPAMDATRAAACNAKHDHWRTGVTSQMNVPFNWGGWAYQRYVPAPPSGRRADFSHEGPILDRLNSWLAPAVGLTHLNAGIAYDGQSTFNYSPGDLAAGADVETSYIGGAIRVLQFPYAAKYVDLLVGRVAATLPAAGGTDAGGYAAAALNLILVHKGQGGTL